MRCCALHGADSVISHRASASDGPMYVAAPLMLVEQLLIARFTGCFGPKAALPYPRKIFLTTALPVEPLGLPPSTVRSWTCGATRPEAVIGQAWSVRD